MNLTLALLGGLVLIFPGLTAIVAWHAQSGRDGVRRSELPLTSVVSLVLIIGASFVCHLFGWAMIELGLAAVREIQSVPGSIGVHWAIPENSYELAVRLAERRVDGGELPGVVGLLFIIGLESALAWALVSSRGLTLVTSGFDVGNQGWVFQSIILPTRHGAKPIAFVFTNAQNGPAGLAYRGVVVEARQSADGELKGLTLANPEAFLYAVEVGQEGSTAQPSLRRSTSRRLDGVLTLEASVIRNVLVQTIPDLVVDDIVNDVPETGESHARAAVKPKRLRSGRVLAKEPPS